MTLKRKYALFAAGVFLAIIAGMMLWNYLRPKPSVTFPDGTVVTVEKVECFRWDEGETLKDQIFLSLAKIDWIRKLDEKIGATLGKQRVLDAYSGSASGGYFDGLYYLKLTLACDTPEVFIPEPYYFRRHPGVSQATRESLIRDWFLMKRRPAISRLLLSDEHDCELGQFYPGSMMRPPFGAETSDESGRVVFTLQQFNRSWDSLKLRFVMNGLPDGIPSVREVSISNPSKGSAPDSKIISLPAKLVSDQTPQAILQVDSPAGVPKFFINGNDETAQFDVSFYSGWGDCISTPKWSAYAYAGKKETYYEQAHPELFSKIQLPAMSAPAPGKYVSLKEKLDAPEETAIPLMLFGVGIYCFGREEIIFATMPEDTGNKEIARTLKMRSENSDYQTICLSAENRGYVAARAIGGLESDDRALIVYAKTPFLADRRSVPRKDINSNIYARIADTDIARGSFMIPPRSGSDKEVVLIHIISLPVTGDGKIPPVTVIRKHQAQENPGAEPTAYTFQDFRNTGGHLYFTPDEAARKALLEENKNRLKELRERPDEL